MKKIYLFLIAILFAFTSCNNNDVIMNPAQRVSIYDYCGYEVRAKMSDGSSKSTHYYFCLQNKDTTLYNVSVSKKVYLQYELGDTISGCEETETEIKNNGFNVNETQSLNGAYNIVTINGEKYMVIKIDSKDTTLINE